jgi:hypothetical protein
MTVQAVSPLIFGFLLAAQLIQEIEDLRFAFMNTTIITVNGGWLKPGNGLMVCFARCFWRKAPEKNST